MSWRNRIVGYGEKPARDFLANPANWRIHPHTQEQALTGLLDDVGWVTGVVENITTGHLVDGHLRVLAALKAGEDTLVPYLQVELTEHEEAEILATLDPVAALAGTDAAKYADLLGNIGAVNSAVSALLSSISQPSSPEPEPATEPATCETCGQKIRRRK